MTIKSAEVATKVLTVAQLISKLEKVNPRCLTEVVRVQLFSILYMDLCGENDSIYGSDSSLEKTG